MALDENRWKQLAMLSGQLESASTPERRAEVLLSCARSVLSFEQACLVAIGKQEEELRDPNRNRLPFFEYIALQKSPVAVDDALEVELELPPEIASWRFPALLFMPLWSGTEALGVLALGSTRIRDFSDEDQHLLQAMMPLLTHSLERDLREQERARLARRNRLMLELDEVMLETDLNSMLLRASHAIQDHFEVERVLFFLPAKGRFARGLDVAYALGCPYAASGCLKEHACGRLANELAEARLVETRNEATLATYVGVEHELCQERQVALVPVATNRKVLGSIQLFNRRDGLDFAHEDLELLEGVGQRLGIALENHALFGQVEEASLESIKGLALALDSKDRYTANHSENVSGYGQLIAAALGLDETACERIRLAGILHDIGKIGIPDAILNKPAALTDEEFKIIKTHPGKGFRILEPFKQLRDVADAACSHHERFDGNGYPRKLKGDQISLGGRILALADAFDTMTSDRGYRPRIPIMKALLEVRRCAGSHFDPEVVRAFFRALAGMGPLDLNKNILPPEEALDRMADLDLPNDLFQDVEPRLLEASATAQS
jgi:HD-GYP domain-containing protein (c-di-GMP phosphodiesterase class II)